MQGKKVPPLVGHSIEEALTNGDEVDVLKAVVVKYAHAIDHTDSARDVRALAKGLLEALDKLKQAAATDTAQGGNRTPLAVIMGKADEG